MVVVEGDAKVTMDELLPLVELLAGQNSMLPLSRLVVIDDFHRITAMLDYHSIILPKLWEGLDRPQS
jgi:hypothetical protein